ncbi:MAG: hypothetical protein GQ550_02850 [Gammaproteobacteria bacterium]|nr:hypothetical protein [Gammaproteobacteria bacterium]
MFYDSYQDGWSRVNSGLDVELKHGIPVRVSNSKVSAQFNERTITNKILQLTGFTVSMHDWMSISADEQECTICIDKNEFADVLKQLAASSAAMFVDRFHKPIDHTAVDWDRAEFSYDFNQAIEHCCLPYDSLDKDYYFERYLKTMHEESVRLVSEGVSPMVESE